MLYSSKLPKPSVDKCLSVNLHNFLHQNFHFPKYSSIQCTFSDKLLTKEQMTLQKTVL